MKDKEGEPSLGCSVLVTLFGVGIIASVLYHVWRFFHRPDALARIIEMLQAMGICCGIFVLLVVIIGNIPPSWLGYTEDDDDYY
jgi:hypothetical protein